MVCVVGIVKRVVAVCLVHSGVIVVCGDLGDVVCSVVTLRVFGVEALILAIFYMDSGLISGETAVVVNRMRQSAVVRAVKFLRNLVYSFLPFPRSAPQWLDVLWEVCLARLQHLVDGWIAHVLQVLWWSWRVQVGEGVDWGWPLVEAVLGEGVLSVPDATKGNKWRLRHAVADCVHISRNELISLLLDFAAHLWDLALEILNVVFLLDEDLPHYVHACIMRQGWQLLASYIWSDVIGLLIRRDALSRSLGVQQNIALVLFMNVDTLV